MALWNYNLGTNITRTTLVTYSQVYYTLFMHLLVLSSSKNAISSYQYNNLSEKFIDSIFYYIIIVKTHYPFNPQCMSTDTL